jgi:diacylglycerol kinase (ATP)
MRLNHPRLERLHGAALNTVRGLAHAVRSEAALREECAVLAVALPLGAMVAPSFAWYVAMIGVLLLVLAVELLNTAVEKLADHVTPEWNRDIGIVKDIGSAAVFCVLLLAGLVWSAALAVRIGLV